MCDTQDYTMYLIEKTRPSASAIIIFARHPHTNKNIVLKVLKEMKDERYDLSTIEKRQQCQMEAWRWNPRFTPDIYLGLAQIRETLKELEQKKQTLKEIAVGPILDNPRGPSYLIEKKEYALVMRPLPEDRWLDVLLGARDKEDRTIPWYLPLLVKQISDIHAKVIEESSEESKVNRWGSIEQLREKLRENLALLEKASTQKPNLSDICHRLQKSLPPVLEMEKYQGLFDKRLKEKHIKHCHGDLKADNIWVALDSLQCDEKPEVCVKLLDCIDFNLSFCMIDTLSDIALLVVDIQARTGNPDLANAVIDEYLCISDEDEEAARYLLAYYLVEKAIIGTVNSYIDDKNDVLGTSYTMVVYQRMDELMSKIHNKNS
jgi:uncharacterized protein